MFRGVVDIRVLADAATGHAENPGQCVDDENASRFLHGGDQKRRNSPLDSVLLLRFEAHQKFVEFTESQAFKMPAIGKNKSIHAIYRLLYARIIPITAPVLEIFPDTGIDDL